MDATILRSLWAPPTQDEQVTLTQRDKWSAVLVPFDICVDTGSAKFDNITQLVKQSRTAHLYIDPKPGTGNSVHGRFKSPYEMRDARVICASTAKVLAFQTVLELCLIFYGIRLKPINEDCAHAPDGFCALDLKSATVDAKFTRYELPQASLPTERQAHTSQWSSPQDIQLEHLTQSLWSFVDPSNHAGCVVYIQLKTLPAPKLDLPRSTLISLLRRIQAKREGKLPPLIAEKNQAKLEDEGGNKNTEESPESEQPKKRRKLSNSTTANNGAGAMQASPATQADNTNKTRPSRSTFRQNVLDVAKETQWEHCAVLREQEPLEAAHLIPHYMNPALMDQILEAVFQSSSEQSIRALTSERRRCLPLFAPRYYPYPSNWTDMDDFRHNALLINPTVHELMDSRYNLLIVRANLIVVGDLKSRTELSCYDPPCPTIQMHNITRETVQDPQFKIAQIRHESAVKPLTVDASIQTWALLHLRSAASFYAWFMEGCPSTLSLLSFLTTDSLLREATTEVIEPGRDVWSDEASRGGPARPQNSKGRSSPAQHDHSEPPGARQVPPDLHGKTAAPIFSTSGMSTPDPSPDKVQSAGIDAAKTSRSRHSDAGDRVAGDSFISSEEQEHLSLVKRDDASTSPMGPISSQLPDFFIHGGGSSEHNMSGPQLLSTTHTMRSSDTFLQYVDEILGKIYDEDADLYWNELDKALKSIHFLTALCALGARESQGP